MSHDSEQYTRIRPGKLESVNIEDTISTANNQPLNYAQTVKASRCVLQKLNVVRTISAPIQPTSKHRSLHNKVNRTQSNTIDTKRIVYGREFLLESRNWEISRSIPDNLPSIVGVTTPPVQRRKKIKQKKSCDETNRGSNIHSTDDCNQLNHNK